MFIDFKKILPYLLSSISLLVTLSIKGVASDYASKEELKEVASQVELIKYKTNVDIQIMKNDIESIKTYLKDLKEDIKNVRK